MISYKKKYVNKSSKFLWENNDKFKFSFIKNYINEIYLILIIKLFFKLKYLCYSLKTFLFYIKYVWGYKNNSLY